MASASSPRGRDDFGIVVICTLSLEAECVYDILDKIWDGKKYGTAQGDDNAYTLGAIGEHNVVLVHMAGMGTIRAAYAVGNLKLSFPNIKLALVVGICGGMPYVGHNEELMLGDVVISKTLIQYDYGRQYPQGFKRKADPLDTLGPPSERILSLLNKLSMRQHMQILQNNTAAFLQEIQRKSPNTKHPGIENDILYNSSYNHQHHSPATCDECEKGDQICEAAVQLECEDLECESNMRVPRSGLIDSSTKYPRIYFGIMGSGDAVMKSGYHRDVLARKEGIIALEMEGAGVWRHGPSIVIKGVCDYADSHKRKGWQQYSAAAAAACAKAFLIEWSPEETRSSSAHEARTNEFFLVPRQSVKDFVGREDELTQIASYFDDKTDQPRILVLHAMGGQGKTQIALQYCQRARQAFRGVFWVNSSSTLTATQSVAIIARELDRSAAVALLDDDARVALALRTLERCEERWLMVFDNCDDPTTFCNIEQFFPQVGRGNILFTSRHLDLEELGSVIKIPPMPPRAGVALLLHRYCGVNIDDHMSEATAIVDRLGNLALAIDQASAYMQYIHLPLNRLNAFLPQYLAQRVKVLQHTTRSFWKYTKISDANAQQTAINAFTTWEMSFQQLLDNWETPDSVAHFLTLSAFFSPMSVHEFLFVNYSKTAQPPPSWTKIFTVPSTERTTTEAIPNETEQKPNNPENTTTNPSQAA